MHEQLLGGVQRFESPCSRIFRFGEWSTRDAELLNHYQLLTAKPVVYLVNLSKADYIRKKVRAHELAMASMMAMRMMRIAGCGSEPGAICESISNTREGERYTTVAQVLQSVTVCGCLLSAQNKHLPRILEWVAAHGDDPIIPFSGAYENELLDMPADERAHSEKEAGVPSAVSKIITTGFK